MLKHKEHASYLNPMFFVMSCIEWHKDNNIKYCSTGDIWADQFTKPQSGKLFQKMKNQSLTIN